MSEDKEKLNVLGGKQTLGGDVVPADNRINVAKLKQDIGDALDPNIQVPEEPLSKDIPTNVAEATAEVLDLLEKCHGITGMGWHGGTLPDDKEVYPILVRTSVEDPKMKYLFCFTKTVLETFMASFAKEKEPVEVLGWIELNEVGIELDGNTIFPEPQEEAGDAEGAEGEPTS